MRVPSASPQEDPFGALLALQRARAAGKELAPEELGLGSGSSSAEVFIAYLAQECLLGVVADVEALSEPLLHRCPQSFAILGELPAGRAC